MWPKACANCGTPLGHPVLILSSAAVCSKEDCVRAAFAPYSLPRPDEPLGKREM